MLTINNPLETDILVVLMNASQRRLQRHKIRDKLRSKYLKTRYARGSFDVVLQRSLNHLCILGALQKDYVARAVFYFIPNSEKGKVKLFLYKQGLKKEIDQMSPEEIQKLKKTLDAALSLLRQRKITDALDEGRERMYLRELDVEKDIEREIKRPKLSDVNLFDINKKLWPQFLQEKHPDIWTLVKDEKPASMPKDIQEQFEEYRKKELSAGSWEERSNQKETKKG
jgi:hypothetical protein